MMSSKSKFLFSPGMRVALLAALAGSLTALGGCSTFGEKAFDSTDDALKMSLTLKDYKPNPLTPPATELSQLAKFGKLIETYRGPEGRPVYVQSRTIGDSTGLSQPLVGSELPYDITEMVRSAINNIGTQVVYVPFHPDYVVANSQQGVNMSVTVPDILVTGAITQFDRAVSSTGRSRDFGFLFGGGRGETSGTVTAKSAGTVSTLGLDFNVIDFKTQTMIPKVQAVNTMNVLNESAEGGIDFSIYGNGIGYNGSARRMHGRHQAIRTLVDVSIIQLIGRYTNLPYWRIMPGTAPDEVVIDRMRRSFLTQSRQIQTCWIQNTLKDYGEAIQETCEEDEPTHAAIKRQLSALGEQTPQDIISPDVFLTLYVNVPLPRSIVKAADS